MQGDAYEIQYGGPTQGGVVGDGGPGVLPETGGIDLMVLIVAMMLVAAVLHVRLMVRSRRG